MTNIRPQYHFESTDQGLIAWDVRRLLEHLQLILACDLSYSIILADDGRVMDGMHRVCKAVLRNR